MSVLTDLIYGGSNAVAGLTEGAVNDATPVLAWRIPWTEEPRGLPSIVSQRVGHD